MNNGSRQRDANRIAWIETQPGDVPEDVRRAARESIGQRATMPQPLEARIAMLEGEVARLQVADDASRERIERLERELGAERADRSERDREICGVIHALIDQVAEVADRTGSMVYAEATRKAVAKLSPPEVTEAMGDDLTEYDVGDEDDEDVCKCCGLDVDSDEDVCPLCRVCPDCGASMHGLDECLCVYVVDAEEVE